jgi:hypothetical protein
MLAWIKAAAESQARHTVTSDTSAKTDSSLSRKIDNANTRYLRHDRGASSECRQFASFDSRILGCAMNAIRMAPETACKLAKLLGMLGLDHDGEVIAAGSSGQPARQWIRPHLAAGHQCTHPDRGSARG